MIGILFRHPKLIVGGAFVIGAVLCAVWIYQAGKERERVDNAIRDLTEANETEDRINEAISDAGDCGWLGRLQSNCAE